MLTPEAVIPIFVDLVLTGLRPPWSCPEEQARLAELWVEALPSSWTTRDLRAAAMAYTATPKAPDRNGELFPLAWPTPGHIIAARPRRAGGEVLFDLHAEYRALVGLGRTATTAGEHGADARSWWEQGLTRRYGQVIPGPILDGLAAVGGFPGFLSDPRRHREGFIAAAMRRALAECRNPTLNDLSRPTAWKAGDTVLRVHEGGRAPALRQLDGPRGVLDSEQGGPGEVIDARDLLARVRAIRQRREVTRG